MVSIYFEVNNSGELLPDGRFDVTDFPENIYPKENIVAIVSASKILNGNATDHATFVFSTGGYAALDNPAGSGIKHIYVSITYISKED